MVSIEIQQQQDYWRAGFSAMASPCELLMEVEDAALAEKIAQQVAAEVWRIEQKFSRYRKDNIIYRINNADGKAISLDAETARLIDFSQQLYDMSDGLFDITSGVLRKVWNFDGSDRVPKKSAVKKLLKYVGWHRVNWQNQTLTLPRGMQIDLGGIGKEYAVDRCTQIAAGLTSGSVLVNFGGDLAMTGQRKKEGYWSVGRLITGQEHSVALFKLTKGAIATSGDAHRFLFRDGVRYSHVLNPRTGWPISNAPHTVSIAAPTCTEAGILSTLALLQGDQAEAFLKLQQVDYWLD